jgi:glycosyltransferase involved in cell wall biosynthesis
VTVTIGVNALFVRPGIVGGTETYVVELLRAMAGRLPEGLELVVYAGRGVVDEHPALADQHRVVVAPGRDVGPGGRVVLEHSWLAWQARRDGVAAVHHLGGTMPAVRSSPGIVTVHDLQPLLHPERFSAIKRTYLGVALPRSVSTAAAVVAVSDFTRRQIIERLAVPAARVHVVSTGLDPVAAPDRPVDVRRAYDLGTGPYFLYPAITYVHKNHTTLVGAFAALAAERPDVTLVLTGGEADAEGDVGEAIERLGLRGRVRRTGRVPAADLDALYRGAAALVLPSRYEGFGIPVLEAMARGCPVIAADATALPEAVAGAGLLVGPDDETGWTDAMRRLLDDEELARELRDAGARRAAERTWARSARDQVAVYESVLAEVSRR